MCSGGAPDRRVAAADSHRKPTIHTRRAKARRRRAKARRRRRAKAKPAKRVAA
ncbi:hypothetical protein I548_2235 [Mycobacterium intracellulare]|nr:hypothetical protein I548_2235 [Mycobacterium intracellulare]